MLAVIKELGSQLIVPVTQEWIEHWGCDSESARMIIYIWHIILIGNKINSQKRFDMYLRFCEGVAMPANRTHPTSTVEFTILVNVCGAWWIGTTCNTTGYIEMPSCLWVVAVNKINKLNCDS